MSKSSKMITEYLMLGAIMKKVIEIDYIQENKRKRVGGIQPIKWLEGREGLQILTWDTDSNDWRRFEVSKIIRVTITDMEWRNTEVTHSMLAG